MITAEDRTALLTASQLRADAVMKQYYSRTEQGTADVNLDIAEAMMDNVQTEREIWEHFSI